MKKSLVRKLAAAALAFVFTAMPMTMTDCGITVSAEDYTYVAAVPSSCTSTGVKEHYVDASGNKYIIVNGAYQTVNYSDLVTPVTSHTYGETMFIDGLSINVCTVCKNMAVGTVPSYNYYYGYPYYYDYYDYYYDFYYGYPYSYYYDYYYGYPYSYYGYPYYYNYFVDPYYSVISTPAKEAEYGTPYVNGVKTRAGWDTAVKYIKKAKAGSTVTLNLNGASTIDDSVLSALKGRDVTLEVKGFGTEWEINGKYITSPKNLDLTYTPNSNVVPENLKAKAGRDTLGVAEFSVGSSGSLGCSADISISVGREYAGGTVILYRYDPLRNSLRSTGTAVVTAGGKAKLSVKNGGAYVMVIK